jgi:hypothetical protein
VAGERRAYLVREAGKSGRPGKVYKLYPYTLRALEQAIDDARFRSFTGTAQELVKVDGRARTVVRRFEGGREVPPAPG